MTKRQGEEDPIDIDTLKLPDRSGPAYVAAATDVGARNFLQGAIIRRSDETCDRHKASIHTNAAVFNVSTGFLTSALAGAGAVVTGTTAVNILSGSAALTNSTRSLVNEEVYQEMLAAAIIAEIDENRRVAHEALVARRAGDTATYTVEDAVRDAIAYHQLCSFYQGVASMVKKAGVTQRSQEELIENSITKLRAEKEKDKAELAGIESRITAAAGDAALVEALKDQRKALMAKIDRIRARLSVMDTFL
ncbi:MAG: hypothetical protein RIC16_05325 [Rhodospirillales bacterium]